MTVWYQAKRCPWGGGGERVGGFCTEALGVTLTAAVPPPPPGATEAKPWRSPARPVDVRREAKQSSAPQRVRRGGGGGRGRGGADRWTRLLAKAMTSSAVRRKMVARRRTAAARGLAGRPFGGGGYSPGRGKALTVFRGARGGTYKVGGGGEGAIAPWADSTSASPGGRRGVLLVVGRALVPESHRLSATVFPLIRTGRAAVVADRPPAD